MTAVLRATGCICRSSRAAAGTVNFLEEDLKTSLPRKLSFASSDKILQLAEHVGALRNLESRQAIEHGVSIRRGGVFLSLTHEQYVKLK